MNKPIDEERFGELLAERFPVIAAEADEGVTPSIFLRMGALAKATQGAIREGDRAAVKALFEFVSQVYRHANPDVCNAICVSYLEQLDFDGRRATAINARQLLPTELQNADEDLGAYNLKLFERKKP